MESSDIEGLKAKLKVSKDKVVDYEMTLTMVQEPQYDVVLKAQLMSANKLIFELIQ
jgi:hypothetical protein